jgi:hypothetical protein
MKRLIPLLMLTALFAPAQAQNQGCGANNPRCLVPTAPYGTNNSQAASTAFVQGALDGSSFGNVSGPGSSTNGYVATWNGTGGTQLNSTPPLQIYGTQSANQIFGGPASGSATYPSFRSLTANDLPASTALIIWPSAHALVGNTTAPALTSCGTSPSISGTDVAATVTMGTGSPTGCTITFNTAFTSAPHCTVTWHGTPLTTQTYAVTNTALTLAQQATSSDIVDYQCIGPNGG